MKKFWAKGGGAESVPTHWLEWGYLICQKLGGPVAPPVPASLVLSLRFQKKFYDTADKYDLVPRYIEGFKDTD